MWLSSSLCAGAAQVIKRSTWRATWKLPTRIVYGILCLALLVSTLLGANSNNEGTAVQQQQQWVSGIIFGFLASAFAWVTYHVLHLEPQQYSRMFMMRPTSVAAVVVVLFVVFVSRAVFDVVTAAGAVTISTGGQASTEDVAIFVSAYLWWEVLPIVLLLATIAAGRVGQASTTAAAPAIGVFGAIQAMQGGDGNVGDVSDSDDETAVDRGPLVASLLGTGDSAGLSEAFTAAAPHADYAQLPDADDRVSTGYEIPNGGGSSSHARTAQEQDASLGASTFGTMRGGRTLASTPSGAGSFHDAYEAYLQQQAIMAQTGMGGMPLDEGGVSAHHGMYVGSGMDHPGLPARHQFTQDSHLGMPSGGRGSSTDSGPSTRPSSRDMSGAGLANSGFTSRSFADRHADRVFDDVARYDTPPGQGLHPQAGVGSYGSRDHRGRHGL